MASPFAEMVTSLIPPSWFEKPVLSPTSKSLVFSSENKAMSILGYQQMPQLKEYLAAPHMRIRIIDQHFILINAKNKINDQIVSLRKRTDRKDFFSSIFKPTQEDKNRLAMLESKQKTIPEYEFPYFVIISGPEYETVEDEARDLAGRTQGKVLSFQTLIVAYETAAWDQCKDITHPDGL